ncbi:hypothetical protein C3B61_15020 [Cryobacterium zongtaii]|uniref:Uncharacterized protein n=1 Tax=Cryobacterium zongtaii TaxID=1259217 RepID=A0A2S3ZBI6_9MICO|nr:hypothetical protein [Cryobacterium zongtaii]POH62987.1 hypothetical protein C3B61_15020 [Cryobacterium zongtaii]
MSPWGEFFYRVASFMRVGALSGVVVIGGLVVAYLLRNGWAAFLLPACIEMGGLLAVGFLLHLVVVARNRSVRP